MRIIKLIAVILADGSVDKKRYTISFTEDERVVKRLVKEFNEFEDIKLKWKLDKQINSYRARVYSKKLTNLLYTYSPSFRMRAYSKHPIHPTNSNQDMPPTKIPKTCFSNKKSITEFLKYYITCDGGP